MNTSKTVDQQPILANERTYISFRWFLFNVFAVCCGSFFFGITLSYLSIFPIEQIKTQFKITIDSEVTKGVFNAIVPAGAFIGAFLSSFFIKHLTRRISLLVICGIAVFGGILTLVPFFIPMAIGRFIQGIAVGLYSSICPLIINQLSPVQLAGRLGMMNQLFIVLGVDLSNFLTLAISTDNKPGDPITYGWRFIFSIPIAIAIIQACLLLFVYKHETPKYLLLVGKTQQAKRLIEQWYLPQFVDSIFDRLFRQTQKIKMQSMITDNHDLQQQTNNSNTSLAIIMGFHLGLLQQFCGTNLVVIYCGDIFNMILSPGWIKPSRIMLQSVKLIGIFGATYFIKTLGRKTLIQIGCAVIGTILLSISICFIINNTASQYAIVAALFCFTISFGFTLGPVVWMYIPQFLQAKWVPFTTMTNWAGCMIIVLLFPIIQEAMGTSIYIFLFLALWCYGSGIVNHFLLVQTKNKDRQQINKQYENKCN